MDTKPISVFVIEDSRYIAEAYKTKFESNGYAARFAYDGKEAIAMLKTFTPDVIILDIVMPNSDGFDVMKVLRDNRRLAKIPVIVATNLGDNKSIDKAHSLGSNEYVVKSELSLSDIANRINEIKNEL